MGVEYPYIVKDAKVCGGRAVIAGTRISVSSLIEYYQRGMGVEELWQERFPGGKRIQTNVHYSSVNPYKLYRYKSRIRSQFYNDA